MVPLFKVSFQSGLVGIVLALSACATAPSGTADRQKFDTAIAAVGCKVDSDEVALQVEAMTGLTPDQLGDLVVAYWEEGRMQEAPNGGFILTTGPCAK